MAAKSTTRKRQEDAPKLTTSRSAESAPEARRPIEFIRHPDFDRPGAKALILRECPAASEEVASPREVSFQSGSLSYLNDVVDDALLSREQEQHLFRQMNYLKFLAAEEAGRNRRDRGRQEQEVARLLAESDRVRDRILRSNLRLVVSIAKKYVNAANSLDELISEGNLSLIQAVEKFDISLGNRFSTYATRALRNNLYHYVTDKHRRSRQVGLSDEEVLHSVPAGETTEYQDLMRIDEIRRLLGRVMGRLDREKRSIVSSRFGLNYREMPRTLKEIAHSMSVSRERVRQIESRAMRQLRRFVLEERIDLAADGTL